MDRFAIWSHHEVSVEPCDIINKSLKNKVPVCFRKQSLMLLILMLADRNFGFFNNGNFFLPFKDQERNIFQTM